MCGIHGIIHFDEAPRGELKDKVGKMLHAAGHRGPDESDTLVFDQSAIGMNRLAIIAPNEHATIQADTKNKVYALFNGEIVNHRDLRKALGQPIPDSGSDGAVILPMLSELGEDYIKKLAGMFAIAIYDAQNHKLQLWRDPLGVKPLYYHHSNGQVIFSSEIKSIYAAMDQAPEVDFGAIDDMLKYRFHPGRSTVIPGIQRVLPGESVTFSQNRAAHQQYWNLRPNPVSSNRVIDIDEFRALLTEVVAQNATADVPGGFFVSGGLDSSLITSMALRESSSYKQPISINFTPRPVVDEGYGKLLESYLGSKFEWVEISNSIAREALAELVQYIDEPLENPIHIGTYLMAKRAKELGIKSVLTGDGSDEFFLGYQRHACWFNDQEGDPTVAYPKWLWTLRPDEGAELYTQDAKASMRPMVDAFDNRIEPFSDVNQALKFERGDRLSEYHCMRLDRMTMAHGVEAKVPFLDHRIADYALQIPLTTLFGKSGKGWLQEVSKPWVPPEILNRPKVHFPSLPDQWLSGAGSGWAAEILLDNGASIHKWMRRAVVERYLNEHKDESQNRGRLLWALLTLELWLKNLPQWRK